MAYFWLLCKSFHLDTNENKANTGDDVGWRFLTWKFTSYLYKDMYKLQAKNYLDVHQNGFQTNLWTLADDKFICANKYIFCFITPIWFNLYEQMRRRNVKMCHLRKPILIFPTEIPFPGTITIWIQVSNSVLATNCAYLYAEHRMGIWKWSNN